MAGSIQCLFLLFSFAQVSTQGGDSVARPDDPWTPTVSAGDLARVKKLIKAQTETNLALLRTLDRDRQADKAADYQSPRFVLSPQDRANKERHEQYGVARSNHP